MKQTKFGVHKIQIWLIAVLVVAALAAGVVYFTISPKTQKPAAVLVGDSIFAVSENRAAVDEAFSGLVQGEVKNLCLGGNCATAYGTMWMNPYSFEYLVTAICSGDFSLQKANYPQLAGMEYFPQTIETMEQIDFRNLEVLFLCYGTNDFHLQVPVEEFYNGLKQDIALLQSTYPDLKIKLISSPYCWYPENLTTCEDYLPIPLIRYVDAMREAAKETEVDFIDIYHNGYRNEEAMDVTLDGVHPNQNGMKRILDAIREQY